MAHVRRKEAYGGFRVFRWLSFQWKRAKVLGGLILHLAFAPQWVKESPFRLDRTTRLRGVNRLGHPLFGWWVWGTSFFTVASVLYLAVGALSRGAQSLTLDASPALLRETLRLLKTVFPTGGLIGAGILAGLCVASALFLKAHPSRLFARLEIQRGLLSDYHLHRRLHELFGEESSDSEPRIESDPFPLVLVAAPLNQLEKELAVVPVGQQVWAGRGARLVEALRAALALPFLFSPRHVEGADVDDWIVANAGQPKPQALDLVDGSAVRGNPVPAVVAFLRQPKNRELARRLEGTESTDCRLHLVSSTPTLSQGEGGSEASGRMNIVEVVRLSLELAKRRDIEMECTEVNFLSEVENVLFGAPTAADAAKPEGGDTRLLQLFIDEIVPGEELTFGNPFAPEPGEILWAAATGCRRTLERLYGREIRQLTERKPRSADPNRPMPPLPCQELLRHLARDGGPRDAERILPKAPGLAEICRECQRHLHVERPTEPEVPGFGIQDEAEIHEGFPHLTGTKPRICFLASGGVFRGATHIGVLGALRVAGIRPDLIVGASVGALIGGVLGAISVLEDGPAFRLLGELANTFREVDERIALTRTLKNAARQLGTRARRVKLSPRDFQRMIERGTRSDAGFAATSAPPGLVDAMAELTLLPYQDARKIATEFVAGHYAEAAKAFLEKIQKETLPRLGIEYEVMGSSLLAQAAYRLLGGGAGIHLNQRQPFHRGEHPVSFFCTASSLGDRTPRLLGRDFPAGGTSFDFIEAVLSSSAFPGIFAPRRESTVFPDFGREDVLLADGGMFDNLPFYPAIDVLKKVQISYARQVSDRAAYAEQIFSQPVLFIAAALEANPPRGLEHGHGDLLSIYRRSAQLKSNLKMLWFGDIFEHLGRQLNRLRAGQGRNQDFCEGIVQGGVLKIIPTDGDHLNQTFAFCASTGLETDRVNRAIADGCFQTFRAFAEAQARSYDRETMLDRSIAALEEHCRIPRIELEEHPQRAEPQDCPYFRQEERSFRCPFIRSSEQAPELAPVAGVFAQCIKDDTRRPALRGAH